MSQETKQSPSTQTAKEQKPAASRRPSHDRVADDIDKWANSPGLQPPK